MKNLKQFYVSFSGLKEGEHWFKFDVDNAFFEYYNESEIYAASIAVDLCLNKKSTLIELEFEISGFITLACNRCNEEINYPLAISEKVYLKFGSEAYTQTDDIIILPENAHEINIGDLIHEFCLLKKPMRIVHEKKDCNQEVINQLEEIEEQEIEEQNNNTDPRWDILKNFNKNNN